MTGYLVESFHGNLERTRKLILWCTLVVKQIQDTRRTMINKVSAADSIKKKDLIHRFPQEAVRAMRYSMEETTQCTGVLS
jgi:hypothetical protein